MHRRQATPLADCCWPRDIWKRRHREGVFLHIDLWESWHNSKGLRGVQRAPDQYAATHCLLGTEKNIREWGHRRQVLKGGALPNKSSTGAPRQAPRLSLSAGAVWKDCYEGPSASFPTFTPVLICLSLEWNLPASPSLPSDLLIGCDRTNTPGTNKGTCLSCLWLRAGLKYFVNGPRTIS